jgi:hypothetical protein
MDDEAQQLEAELKRLQPAPPSRRLLERLESELGASRVRHQRSTVIWLWVGALSAAAAIGVLVPRFGGSTSADPTSNLVTNQATLRPLSVAQEATFKPVAAENVLISAKDEGLVTLADGTPARRERLHYVDTITWQNSRTNASLRWSVPREEVRVVPIAFQ